MNFKIKIFKNKDKFVAKSADFILNTANKAIEKNGIFICALAGGNTPLPIYANFAENPLLKNFPWNKSHFFWGDDRCVPPNHKYSNFNATAETFINKCPIPENNIHRIYTEMNPVTAAEKYEKELLKIQKKFKRERIFDLVILGMGNDGHTASIFPKSKTLNEKEKLVINVPPPSTSKPAVARITLTFQALNQSETALLLIKGGGKLNILNSCENIPIKSISSNNNICYFLSN